VSRWQMTTKGTQLLPSHLLNAGWKLEFVKSGQGYRAFYVEPSIKGRDKVWIEFEHHYYRVYHSESRVFIALESTIEWLQFYLFTLDKYLQCGDTRKLLVK